MSTDMPEIQQTPEKEQEETEQGDKISTQNVISNVVASAKRKRDFIDNGITCKMEGSRTKKHKHAFREEKYDDTEYYFENGLRKVYPYYYTYTSFCKGRWVGRTILDVFVQEFRAFTPEQYISKIESGTVTVNGQCVKVDTLLHDNDLIESKVHRHEVGVLASSLPIVYISDDLVVIDKPPSLPVHPCGRYRHNSVAFILAKEQDLKDLHIIHRLDRLTSGLLLMGRTQAKAKEMSNEIVNRTVSKEYVCRVEGNFPDESVTVDKPIEVLSHKIGICCVSPDGKPATTEFQKLSYNGKSSVVLCKPLTGRMHQIRVHLQYLGYPIVNDPMYNSDAFGPQKGKGGDFGKTKDQLVEDLIKAHNIENWFEEGNKSSEANNVMTDKDTASITNTSATNDMFTASLSHYIDRPDFQELKKKYLFDPGKVTFDANCFDCQHKCRDPEPKDLIMLLHALRYRGNNWEFETPLPVWADAKWDLL